MKDKEFVDFIYEASRPSFRGCTFTAEYMIKHERDFRDAMYVALQALKFGAVEVNLAKFADGSEYRQFTINCDGLNQTVINPEENPNEEKA